MYLKSFSFKQIGGLTFEKVEFQPWNLIVGGSGTGKTSLLKAIEDVCEIGREGRSRISGEWELSFSNSAGVDFEWSGCSNTEVVAGQPRVERESLKRDGEQIFDFENGELKINGKVSDNPPRSGSVLSTSGVPEITEASNELGKLVVSESVRATHFLAETVEEEKYDRNLGRLEELRNKSYGAFAKLCIAAAPRGTFTAEWKLVQEEVEHVKAAFIECFPTVNAIHFSLYKQGDEHHPNFLIEENGSKVGYRKTSSGMIRALVHLAELHFSPDGSVFLIDEFENSLGANCIDQVTSWLMERRRGCQYIMTSHHPKIISEVPMKYWQILSREGNVVTSKTAEQAGLGSSKHSAFLQLMNLKGFNEGPSN